MARPDSDQVRALIRRVLADGGSLYTTALVKLMYFIDLYYFAQVGRSATNLEWIWDEYGPNVVGHEIIRTAGDMAEEGEIVIRPAPGGDRARAYRSLSGARPSFEPLLEVVVTEVISKYREMDVEELKQASKQTRPFESARPGRRLVFSRSSHASTRPSADDWARHREEREKNAGKGIAELRTKYQLD